MLVQILGIPQPVKISPSYPQQNKQSKTGIFILAVLLILIGSLCFIMFSQKHQQPIVKTIEHYAKENNMQIDLPDQSTIDLRKSSKLVHKESWQTFKKRETWLRGEAYFDIEENDKPFIVHLPKGTITVLGTKFLVEAHLEKTQVILEEGKVKFTVDNNFYDLSPGDNLTYENESVIIEKNVETEHYNAWKKGKLAFKNEKLSTIINTINNSYALNISLDTPKLASRKVTASINKNDPILLLDALAVIYDIKLIKKSDKSYILK